MIKEEIIEFTEIINKIVDAPLYFSTNFENYLSTNGDADGIVSTLEKIWLDWKNQGLIEPKWQPIGVDQAVTRILAETK